MLLTTVKRIAFDYLNDVRSPLTPASQSSSSSKPTSQPKSNCSPIER